MTHHNISASTLARTAALALAPVSYTHLTLPTNLFV